MSDYVNKVMYGSTPLIDISSDTVTASNLVSGYTAHDKTGASITGTLDTTPTIAVATDGTITATSGGNSATHTLSSSDDADFVAGNIKSGTNIFGVTGTYAGGSTPTIAVSTAGVITATSGSLSATHTLSSSDDADFIASNIISGKNIFGVTGTRKIYPANAYIIVTFPSATESVTCVSGSTSVTNYISLDSTHRIFFITTYGTYTITATPSSGSITATATATVSSSANTQSVVLIYNTALYASGDECTSITGGWTIFNDTNMHKNDTNISFLPGSSTLKNSLAITANTIDITNYNYLYYEISHNKNIGNDYCGISSDSQLDPTYMVSGTTPTTTTTTSVLVDISSYTGKYYISWKAKGSGSNTIYLSRVELRQNA